MVSSLATLSVSLGFLEPGETPIMDPRLESWKRLIARDVRLWLARCAGLWGRMDRRSIVVAPPAYATSGRITGCDGEDLG